MKKLSVISLLVALCFVLMGVSVYTLVEPLFGYNPSKYVTLGTYKGLEYTPLVEEVTDKEIEYAIDTVVAGFATKEEATQNAGQGDVLTVDYLGKVEGKQVVTFTDKGREITLGSDDFIVPGMDDFLIGANKGQTITATLTVPENYHVDEYIGKQVSFAVTVQKIMRTNIPELTDDFVKQLGSYTSVSDFKQKFATQYRQTKAQEQEAQMRGDLFQMAVDNATVKGYPQKQLEQLKLELREQVQAGATEMEMDFYDYASFAYGLNSKEDYEKYALEYAQKVLAKQMVLKVIAKEESIQLTDDLYQTYYNDYVTAFEAEGYTKEYMLEFYGGEEGLKEQFLLELVTDFIEENAVIG